MATDLTVVSEMATARYTCTVDAPSRPAACSATAEKTIGGYMSSAAMTTQRMAGALRRVTNVQKASVIEEARSDRER